MPTVTLFTQAFAGLADAVALGHQFSDLRRVVLPHPLNNLPEADIRGAVSNQLATIVAGLVQP